MHPTPLLYVLIIVPLVALLPAAVARIRLSRAKHRSLAGHSKISRFFSKMVPYYEYTGTDFYEVDGAPRAICQTREQGFNQLTRRFAEKFAVTVAHTDEIRAGVSDLQFTSAYRVPFPFSRKVRESLKGGNVLVESSGVYVTDLDGNRMFDLTGSYGVNVFGYDVYKRMIGQAVSDVGRLGPVLGAYHPVVAKNVAALKRLSNMDEVSFHMSGTEAVMQAVRLAQYHSRRSHIVRFCGAYHGWWGDVAPGVGNPVAPKYTYTLKEMADTSLHVLRTRDDIACVLINPLQALHPNAPAPADSSLVDSSRRAHFDRAAYSFWLQQVRTVCTARGIALIIDDVFLGFRIARGGSQEYFGVEADLVTFGKTLGGGLPVGVVCGKRQWMKRFRDDRPADICFARGTFNSHPYVMGAMHAFLEYIESESVIELYADLETIWNRRQEEVNARLAEVNLPVRIANLSSIWTVLFTQPSMYNWMLQYYLRAEGLALSWVGTGRLIFSLNYTDEEFAEVTERFIAACKQMQTDGWWWQESGASNAKIRRKVMREMINSARRAQ